MSETISMPWAKRSEDEPIQVGPYLRVQAVGGIAVMFVASLPIRRLARSDLLGLRAELAGLVATGVVRQADVSRTELVTEATFHRDCAAFSQGGAAAVISRGRRGARGPHKLLPDVAIEMVRLHALGMSNVAIAAKLGVHERSVRRVVPRRGRAPEQSEFPVATAGAVATLSPEVASSPAQPVGEAAAADVAADAAEVELVTTMLEAQARVAATEVDLVTAVVESQARVVPPTDDFAAAVASQRGAELLMARLGQIEEQSALFPPVAHARYAGVLLALALLPTTGLLESVRATVGRLANGLYGVRSVITTLMAMAMLRCKRPEQLRGFNPTALGAVVGLVRAPEMKTLRRKLDGLSGDEEKARELVRQMAKRHVDRVKDAVGFLYIDGHVRPYFGKTTLSKAYQTAMRISLPATTDYWVSDERGAPLLVLVTEGNAHMTTMMPALLAEVRAAVGPDVRPTVVFDRGGYSPKLFKQIVEANFDIITYRKGKHAPVPRSRFTATTMRRGGREVPTMVADGLVRLNGFGLMRRVAVIREDGRQTHVLTTRKDLTVKVVLERMFSRWQQENLFKYLNESFAFDDLWTYKKIEADAAREVPNPRLHDVTRRMAGLRNERDEATLRLHRADTVTDVVDAAQDAIAAVVDLDKLTARQQQLPARVPVGSLREDGKVEELSRATMLMTDVVKMTAYHIETMLLAAIAPHLTRAQDEGRSVIADFMHLDGALRPDGNVLHVILQPAAAPRYTHALAALCEQVNALDACFPETRVRLRFELAGPAAATTNAAA
jgi:hypothetical protein